MSRRERVENDEDEPRYVRNRRGFLKQTGRLRPRSPDVEEFQPRLRFDPVPLYPSLPRYPGSNRGHRRGPIGNMDGDGFNFNPPDPGDAPPDDSVLPPDPEEVPADAANIIREVVREKVWNSMPVFSDTKANGVPIFQTGSIGSDASFTTFSYNFHRNVNLNDEFTRTRKFKMNLLQFRGEIYFKNPLPYNIDGETDGFKYFNGCNVTVAFVYDNSSNTDNDWADGLTRVDYYDVFNSCVDDYSQVPPAAFSVLAPYTLTNPYNKNRFQVLWRKTFHINYPVLDWPIPLLTFGNIGVDEVTLETVARNNEIISSDSYRASRPLCCNTVKIDETINLNKTLLCRINELNLPMELRGRIFPVFVSDYPNGEEFDPIYAPRIRWQARITGHSASL